MCKVNLVVLRQKSHGQRILRTSANNKQHHSQETNYVANLLRRRPVVPHHRTQIHCGVHLDWPPPHLTWTRQQVEMAHTSFEDATVRVYVRYEGDQSWYRVDFCNEQLQ